MKEVFRKVSARISNAVGSAAAFVLALMVVIVWGITGPLFNFSDTWQLVINTGTTIVTFLMVFLIQNTQNRDSKAMHLKLDELIHTTKGARNSFVDLDDMSDDELGMLDEEFKRIHNKVAPSQQMHLLHKKIAAEKARRVSLTSAGHAISSLLKAPLPSVGKNKSQNTKK